MKEIYNWISLCFDFFFSNKKYKKIHGISFIFWFLPKIYESKNRILAPETSTKYNLQKRTPLSSWRPLPKIMSILSKLVNSSLLSWLFYQIQFLIWFLFILNQISNKRKFLIGFSLSFAKFISTIKEKKFISGFPFALKNYFSIKNRKKIVGFHLVFYFFC